MTNSEGAIVRVVEPDDGSGWVKVVDAHGHDGLVPASYLDHDSTSSQSAATHQGSSQFGTLSPSPLEHNLLTSVKCEPFIRTQRREQMSLAFRKVR